MSIKNKPNSKQVSFVLALLAIISSCQQPRNINSVRLIKKDSLELFIGPQISPKTNCMQYVNINEKKLLAYMQKGTISFFDLNQRNRIHQIQYESKGPNGIQGLRGFYFLNFDSIYTFSGIPWTIYHTDSAGTLINTIELKQLQNNNDSYPPPLVQDVFHINNRVVPHNNNLFFSTYIFDPRSIEDITKKSVGISFNKKSGKLKNMQQKYPPLDAEEVAFSSRDFGAEKWVFSFFFSNYIYQLQKDGKYLKFPCKSKFANSKLVPYSKNQKKMEESLKEIILKQRYYSLLYDPWQKVFYRIFYPGIESENVKNPQEYMGLVKNKKRFSVIILNENLEVLGETLMPDDTFDPEMYFINEDGLHFAYHINNSEYDPDYLKFARFKVEETNNSN